MALLTAEDILNKKFSATKFREGYDVEEVDDFLDEVVRTLNSVQEENEDLKSKLAAEERRIAELSRADASSAAVQPAVVEAPTAPEPEPEMAPEPPPARLAPREDVGRVITQADPNAPKKGGWWQRAKASITGQ